MQISLTTGKIALLIIVLLLAMVTPAAAAGTYTVVTAPTVQDKSNQTLGEIKVVFDPNVIGAPDALFFRLPTGFKVFGKDYLYTDVDEVSVGDDVYLADPAGQTIVITRKSGTNALSAGDLSIELVSENEFKVNIVGITGDPDEEGVFYVDFKNIYVPEFEGDIDVDINAPSYSAFSDGSVVIGRTVDGEVIVSVIDTEITNNTFTVKLRIKEAIAGSLEDETNSLRFILPDGYEWTDDIITLAEDNIIWGDNTFYGTFTPVGNEITFDPGPAGNIAEYKSSIPTCFEVELAFQLVDESKATAGDIICTISGSSNTSPSKLVVGRYNVLPILSTYPINGAKNVPINTNITVTFKENIKPGDNAFKIALYKNNDTIPSSWGINGSILTLYPASELDYSVQYTVYIPEKAVESFNNIFLPSSYSFSFTTVNNSRGGSGSGGSGGGTSTPQSINTTTGSATVHPSVGGTVGLGDGDALITIPAGALQGSEGLQVIVQKVDEPPAIQSGFSILGTVYQFTVNNQVHYSFSKPVTLTFTFDPAKLIPGWKPAVHYYDDIKGQWVNLGGTVKGNIITVMVDHLTIFAVFAVPEEQYNSVRKFKDIHGHWAEQNINKLYNLGIVNGYPDGTFKPDENISRAEMTAIVVKVLEFILSSKPDLPKPTTKTMDTINFSDNNNIPSWAREVICKGAERGIVRGYPDGSFRAENSITRAEAVSMILQLLDSIR